MGDQPSLSKGCFVYVPKQTVNPFSEFKNEVWNKAFNDVWSAVESKLKVHKEEISYQFMQDLISYVKSDELTDDKIPTAVLLTGVNLPDHESLFSQLVSELKKHVSTHVALLHPSMCSSLKNTVESMADQFINRTTVSSNVDFTDEYNSDEENNIKEHKRRSCNIPNLITWYNKSLKISPRKHFTNNHKLVIIFPNFEGLSSKVLNDFLLILSNYRSKLPFVIIFGVATNASIINDMISHSVTSKLSIELFQSHRSVHYLNQILHKVFLTKDCPFQLGPKIFKFLINSFLFYDFSVEKFTLGIKYCVMDHFIHQPYKILCTDSKNLSEAIHRLNKEDLKTISQLESFKKYCETLEKTEVEHLSSDKLFLKKSIETLMKNLHGRLSEFYISLNILQMLVSQLPGAPLGKQIRELYVAVMAGGIDKTSSYKECCQLLNFQAKSQLIEKLEEILTFLKSTNYKEEIREKLIEFKDALENLESNSDATSASENKVELIKSRAEFKEKMVALSKKHRGGQYEELREKIINYLMLETLPNKLEAITSLPLYEIIMCDPSRSQYLKRSLIGCPRSDVHHALIQPSHYLKCDCCKVEDVNEISSTLPDICIVYKLHLECGTLINLHDWLQSFSAVVDPESAKDDDMEITPLIQARFMQAVSDLEFMGFIKSSKRKADHVSRMTWGGSAE